MLLTNEQKDKWRDLVKQIEDLDQSIAQGYKDGARTGDLEEAEARLRALLLEADELESVVPCRCEICIMIPLDEYISSEHHHAKDRGLAK
jgi:hypothetical protein